MTKIFVHTIIMLRLGEIKVKKETFYGTKKTYKNLGC